MRAFIAFIIAWVSASAVIVSVNSLIPLTGKLQKISH